MVILPKFFNTIVKMLGSFERRQWFVQSTFDGYILNYLHLCHCYLSVIWFLCIILCQSIYYRCYLFSSRYVYQYANVTNLYIYALLCQILLYLSKYISKAMDAELILNLRQISRDSSLIFVEMSK